MTGEEMAVVVVGLQKPTSQLPTGNATPTRAMITMRPINSSRKGSKTDLRYLDPDWGMVISSAIKCLSRQYDSLHQVAVFAQGAWWRQDGRTANLYCGSPLVRNLHLTSPSRSRVRFGSWIPSLNNRRGVAELSLR